MQDLSSLTRNQTRGPRRWEWDIFTSRRPRTGIWFSMTVPAFLLCISSGFSLACYVPPLFFPSGFSSASCQSKPSSPLHLHLSPQPWKNLKDYVVVFPFKIWSDYSVSQYWVPDIKKNEIMPFASTQMDLQSVTLSEGNQTEEKYHVDIPYMWNPKRNDTSELIQQKEA